MVPISSSVGIVEFVAGTQPLKESMCTFLSDEVRLLASEDTYYISRLRISRQNAPMLWHPTWISVCIQTRAAGRFEGPDVLFFSDDVGDA